MRAGFIFNDWKLDLTGLDFIVCANNYDPESVREREDVKDSARLAAYINLEEVPAHAAPGTINREIADAALKGGAGAFAIREFPVGGTDPRGAGWVDFDGADGRTVGPPSAPTAVAERAFSSYPWPKSEHPAARDCVDLRLSFDRVKDHMEGVAAALAPGWNAIYVDQGNGPMPRYLYDRYVAAGVLRANEFVFWKLRREALWNFALAYLSELVTLPLVVNSRGWLSPHADAITYEGDGKPQAIRLATFVAARENGLRRGRVQHGETWSVDWTGALEADGLVMRGEELRLPGPATGGEVGEGDR